MPTTVDDIIDRLGGAEAAARLTGVGTEAVRKWRQAAPFPSRHWPALIAATGLTLADLSGAARAGRQARNAERPAPLARRDVPPGATAALVLADGAVFWGRGFGAHTAAPAPVGEVCFNTGMTGYQETLTDPSYAGQIITFTFPHIGNVGTNAEDIEATTDRRPRPGGEAGRHRAVQLARRRSTWTPGCARAAWPGIGGRRHAGADRAHPRRRRAERRAGVSRRRPVRSRGAAGAGRGLAGAGGHGPREGGLLPADLRVGRDALGLAGRLWAADRAEAPRRRGGLRRQAQHPALPGRGRLPGDGGAGDRHRPRTSCGTQPDGVFLSNGPGDPAATGEYAVPAIRGVLDAGVPLFGICLGHQLLALALGAKTYKMARGHRGANQPVKDLTTGKVEITSQNHGFAVDPDDAAATAQVTHVSLFDGSNEGLACTDRPAFSVQYHPEASPGPSDSHYLFGRFVEMIERRA